MRRVFQSFLVCSLLATPAFADQPRVMTDMGITQGLVSEVIGAGVVPDVLLDAGTDPHHAHLRPSRVRALSDADLVIWVGAPLTPWLDDVLETNASGTPTLELFHADGADLAMADDDHGHKHGHDHGHNHGHDHAHGGDPHGWLDPEIAAVWVTEIAEALAEADPDRSDVYRENARAAADRFVALKDELSQSLAALGDREIVVFHDAYSHFSRAFGVKVAGSIALGDATDPGAKRLSKLREIVGASNVACVFREPQHSPAAAEALAADAGIAIGTLDPLGANQTVGAGHYEATLRAMAAAILDCAGETTG